MRICVWRRVFLAPREIGKNKVRYQYSDGGAQPLKEVLPKGGIPLIV
jgi:hypothetical protein